MIETLAQKAIVAALQSDWETALQVNMELLKLAPDDVDALNRVSKAYYELGNPKRAVRYCKMALAVDSLNPIANRSIDKYLAACDQAFELRDETQLLKRVTQEFFIEEPGKTKTVALINLGEMKVILGLSCGDNVSLLPGKHRVMVSTVTGRHVGKIPDDLASRLLYLMNVGYKYEAYVRSVSVAQVKVFIRENKSIYPNHPSFPFRTS